MALELIYDLLPKAGTDVDAVPNDVLHRAQQLLSGGGLQQVTGGAGSKGIAKVIEVCVHRQKQNLCFGLVLFYLTRCVDPVQQRQADIRDDYFRIQPRGSFH
jgi:hypothetical protein